MSKKKIEDYKNTKTAIYCETEAESIFINNLIVSIGGRNFHYAFKFYSEIAYSLSDMLYNCCSSLDYFRSNNYEILEAKEFMEDNTKDINTKKKLSNGWTVGTRVKLIKSPYLGINIGDICTIKIIKKHNGTTFDTEEQDTYIDNTLYGSMSVNCWEKATEEQYIEFEKNRYVGRYLEALKDYPIGISTLKKGEYGIIKKHNRFDDLKGSTAFWSCKGWKKSDDFKLMPKDFIPTKKEYKDNEKEDNSITNLADSKIIIREDKITKLIVGQVYYVELGRDRTKYIFKEDRNESVFINITYSSYYTCGDFKIFDIWNNIRFATKEEIQWLDICIMQNKFIHKEEVDKYLNRSLAYLVSDIEVTKTLDESIYDNKFNIKIGDYIKFKVDYGGYKVGTLSRVTQIYNFNSISVEARYYNLNSQCILLRDQYEYLGEKVPNDYIKSSIIELIEEELPVISKINKEPQVSFLEVSIVKTFNRT